MIPLAPDLDDLSGAVTGRATSLFDSAVGHMAGDLAQTYTGARVLITGGAGFIAGQTLRQLLLWAPAKVVVADISENSLAELVRDLRSSALVPKQTAFEPRLVDVTGQLIERVVFDEGPFDVVLAFAAAKHVRSERDAASTLHMLNVNINGTMRAVSAVRSQNPRARVFVVSTDKAADPGSIMGASKRVMEMAVLGCFPDATTTRFANVAFSSGSLLESWLIRLGRGQVLPVPADTRRFFVSPQESGQLCALASIAPQRSIVVPDSDAVGAVELTAALLRVLDRLGLRPEYVDSAQAIEPLARRAGAWPVLVTKRNTPGEKEAESFVGTSESSAPWIAGLELVASDFDAAAAVAFGSWIRHSITQPVPGPSLAAVTQRLQEVLPNLHHVVGVQRLDDRV